MSKKAITILVIILILIPLAIYLFFAKGINSLFGGKKGQSTDNTTQEVPLPQPQPVINDTLSSQIYEISEYRDADHPRIPRYPGSQLTEYKEVSAIRITRRYESSEQDARKIADFYGTELPKLDWNLTGKEIISQTSANIRVANNYESVIITIRNVSGSTRITVEITRK